MGRRSKQFQAFDCLTRNLLAVSKSTIDQRLSAHKEQAALNPRKRGPKPKVKPSGDPSEA